MCSLWVCPLCYVCVRCAVGLYICVNVVGVCVICASGIYVCGMCVLSVQYRCVSCWCIRGGCSVYVLSLCISCVLSMSDF